MRDFQRLGELHRIERRQKRQPQVDIRFARPCLNIGIGRHVPDRVDRPLLFQKGQRHLQIVHVQFFKDEIRVLEYLRQVGLLTQHEIVHAYHLMAKRQQPID